VDASRVQMLHGAVFSKRAPLAAGGISFFILLFAYVYYKLVRLNNERQIETI
jgi:hypothetical protein